MSQPATDIKRFCQFCNRRDQTFCIIERQLMPDPKYPGVDLSKALAKCQDCAKPKEPQVAEGKAV